MNNHNAFVLFFFLLINLNQVKTQNWNPIQGPTGAPIESAIITKETSEIYVLTRSNKVFRSQDKAKTWVNITPTTQVFTGITNAVYKIYESPIGDIYIASENMLLKLSKSNSEWNLLSDKIEILDFSVSLDGKSTYIGARDGFYYSDLGQPFQKLENWSADKIEFLCLGKNNNFLRKSYGNSLQLFKFDDNGKSLKFNTYTHCCKRLFYHKVSKKLFDHYYETNTSIDNGTNWSSIKNPSYIQYSDLVEASDGAIISISDQIWESTNSGKTWFLSTRFNAPLFWNLRLVNQSSISKSNELVVRVGSDAYYLNTNGDQIEIEVPINEVALVDLKPFNKNSLLGFGERKRYLSTDNGLQWKLLNVPVSSKILTWKDGTIASYNNKFFLISFDQFNSNLSKTFPLPIENSYSLLLDNNENLLFISSDKIYISKDKGSNWKLLNNNANWHYSEDNYKINKQDILYMTKVQSSIPFSFDFGVTWDYIPLRQSYTDDNLLSRNNTAYWHDLGRIENGQSYTKDFGKSIEFIPLKWNIEKVKLIDETDNVFIASKDNLSTIKVINTYFNTQTTIDIENLYIEKNEFESLKLFKGENYYLYALKNNNQIFNYSELLLTDNTSIKGSLIIDENNNCIADINENSSSKFEIDLIGNNIRYRTSVFSSGDFKMYVKPGEYKLKLLNNNFIWNECNFPKKIKIEKDQEINIGKQITNPEEHCVSLNSSINIGRLRRCFPNNTAQICVKNEGTTEAKDVLVELFIDPYFEILSSNPVPIKKSGKVWTFIIPKIGILKTFKIELTFEISCTAELGVLHCLKALVYNKQECTGILPLTDTLVLCDINRGAFDPNDKIAFVNGIESDKITERDSIINYLIRFQNTGTDTAFTVKIKDKLDPELDWNSLNVLSASHDYNYQIQDSGLLVIEFPNILLPDSNINSTASNGYFNYQIKLKSNPIFGYSYKNTAYIYFDYNDPVITNTTSTIYTKTTSTKNTTKVEKYKLSIIPNPFEQYSTVQIPQELIDKDNFLHIQSINGLLIQKYKAETNQVKIQKGNLIPGIYVIYLLNNKNNKMCFEKLIVK